MRVYLTALGCKLNQSEVESWVRQLDQRGCTIVDDPAQADVSIINTCTVIHVAERKSRQLVRRLRRANPNARIIITGCYAEMQPDAAAALCEAAEVVPMANKPQLAQTLRIGTEPSVLAQETALQRLPGLRTRAFVPIQDGCDNACTYCIVRVARGRQRSRSVSEVIDEIRAREAEGYREVVLTGVHIGAFGRERGENLPDLVAGILSETQIARVRLSSIEPWDLSPALLPLWENPRLCRHLHLPLQSGSDSTLKRMNRHYSTAEFHTLVDRARQAIPDVAITTDVIVGFPGETDDEFEESAQFIASIGFARIHVFPYSSRPGTAAARMTNQVPPEVKEARGQQMRAIGRASGLKFRQRFVGRTMDVLWESCHNADWEGLTDNYLRVRVSSELDLHNLILPAQLLALDNGGLRGELSPKSEQQATGT